MSRPEFKEPDFLSYSEAEDIQERMMNNLPSDISRIEGDFPYDFTMPTALEISMLINFDVVRALMIAFPEYAWDDWLDLHGEQAHVTRHAATSATGTIQVTANYGTTIPEGTVFAVPATATNEAIEFATTEGVTFPDTQTMDIPVSAVEAGIGGNVPANTIVIMSLPINGVTAITNAEATSGGTDPEDDDSYYERIHAEFEDAQFYVGNDADYIKWAKEVDGIGDCIVEAAAEGPGTVKLVLVDANGRPASDALVQAVYNHIVSPSDRSARLLPTACAQLIVEPATIRSVDFTCTGLVLSGTTIVEVKTAFSTAVMAIYATAKEDNVLRYNSVRPVLADIAGVEDFEDFLMDGGHSNITLESSEYADTGTLTFTEVGNGN